VANEIRWASEALADLGPKYRAAAGYCSGAHDLGYVASKVKNLFGRLLVGFRDNLCSSVVDSFADRLQMVGISASDTDQQLRIADIWKRNRMEGLTGRVMRQVINLGDAFVLVWSDANGLARFYPQPKGTMVVRYEDDGEDRRITEAVKAWLATDSLTQQKRLRVTRYLPDRIERYSRLGEDATVPHSLTQLRPYDEDGGEAIVGNSYDVVPIFHFSNSDDVEEFAYSEIGDVIPLQNALNKSIVDMLTGCEYAALPQRYAIGLEVEHDANGKPISPFSSDPSRVWIASEGTTFGQFDPADLEQFLKVHNDLRAEIARVSRTPLHLLTLNSGDFPSGEALRTAEAPLLAKVRDRQVMWGCVWEEAMRFALRIEGIVEDVSLDTQWEDTAPRNESEMVKAALDKRDVGVSTRQIRRELGYTDEQIDEMDADNEESSRAAAERAMTAFNRA